MLTEKLEKDKHVEKCILLDGILDFVFEERIYDESEQNRDDDLEESYSEEWIDKYYKIIEVNSTWKFHIPKIDSHIIYLSTTDEFNEDLDNISDNYEVIYIDSNHRDIIKKDVDKIVKYFK